MIALQPAVKFNGGGHINHSIFWTNLTPNCTGGPSGWYIYNMYLISYYCLIMVGELKTMIERDFGSVQAMQDQLSAASIAVQGSGWGWLVRQRMMCLHSL